MSYETDVMNSEWHYSERQWDDSATICTKHGNCVAVRPTLLTTLEWKPVAEQIVNGHNKLLYGYNHIPT